MPRFITLGVSLVLVAAACTGTADTTTTITAAPSTSAPTVTAAPTTTVPEPPFEPSVIAVERKRILAEPDGLALAAGLEATIDGAFDDYAGGIIWLQRFDEGVELQHLRAGRSEPGNLWNAQGDFGDTDFRLLDVVAPPSSPPLALVIAGDKLLTVPTTGGSAEHWLVPDLADVGSGGVFHTASLGGELLLVAWADSTDEDACITVDLFDRSGAIHTAALFETCSEHSPVLSDEGDVTVSILRGAATSFVIRSTADGLERDRWQANVTGRIHASNGRIAYPDGRNVGVLTYDGSWSGHESVAVSSIGAASLSRAPLALSELADLGGTAMPTDCSSRGVTLDEQSGLTADVSAMRDRIGAAASTCNLLQLDLLLNDPSFNATEVWWQAEGDDVPVLWELTALLQTPHATVEDVDGLLVYVWPAIAADVDDEAAWRALESLFNLEEIERWRSGGDPYDRMVIRITEDGSWVQASSDY